MNLLPNSSRYIVCRPLYTMTKLSKKVSIEKIKDENDRLVMKSLGLDYEKVLVQEHQCDK